MKLVIRIGGSVIASPFNPKLMNAYVELLLNLKQQGHRIAVVVGGGSLSRELINTAKAMGLDEAAQDEVAISVSRLTAQLMMLKLQGKEAGSVPVTIEDTVRSVEQNSIAIMGGLKPGMTTDTVAALVAEKTGAGLLIKATDVDGVFDKDPKKHKDAKKFDRLSYDELPKILEKKHHEAGIHQDGVIKEKLTYEIMRPEDVGIKESKLVMGKHSGRHALRKKYEELGFHLSDAELEKAYILLKKVADKKKDVFDEDLIVTVRDALRITPPVYKIKNIQSIAGNQVIATATLLLEKEGKLIQDSATGDGPVDAVLKAVNRITGMEGKLIEYTVHSVTRGADAVGEVFMKVDFGKASFIGRAASLDIVDASARAYVDAVNKMIPYQMALAAHNQKTQS